MYSRGSGRFSCYGQVKYESMRIQNMKFKVNDTFMLVHNFAESQCSAFYNNEKICVIKSFAEKCIIPTVSLYFPGTIIKVTKYEFD